MAPRTTNDPRALLGIDTGGTFTDFVLVDARGMRTLKVASTPADPSAAILQGIADLGLADALAAGALRIVHGSTVATNALLERRLARTLYVGNRGLEDIPVLARQTRRALYALTPEPEPDLVPDALRVGTGGRVGANGEQLEPLTEADLDELERIARERGVEAVAINLLYAYRDAEAERRIEARLSAHYFVSRSSRVLPEYREYERGVATYLNAALGPVVSRYLTRFAVAAAGNRLAVMMSSGGTVAVEHAAERAVTLLLSGPAGGVVAASQVGALLGRPRLLTFDMGGTSTDVALVDGGVRLGNDGRIDGLPIAVPMVDMHTIGAGGGSIAYVDSGGILQVGPRSAGADPGPACYGRGGLQATVTDANVVLGRLPAAGFLGGRLPLDRDAAERVVGTLARELGVSLETAAEGIVRVANEHMVAALRLISVERGYDPRDFTLCCYGGAGGLHVCELADALAIREVLLPPAGSVFSALGMLLATPSRELTRALHASPVEALAQLPEVLEALDTQGAAELRNEGVAPEALAYSHNLDVRYRGQSYTLVLPVVPNESPGALVDRFHAAHRARFGHRVETQIEVVNARVRVAGPPPLAELPTTPAEPPVAAIAATDTPRVARAELRARREGPIVVTEPYTCTWVPPHWCAEVGARGEMWLRLREPPDDRAGR